MRLIDVEGLCETAAGLSPHSSWENGHSGVMARDVTRHSYWLASSSVLTTSYYLDSHTISDFPKSEATKTPSKSTGLIPSGLDNGEASWMSLA